MNTENFKAKMHGYLKTKKGLSVSVLLGFCVVLTFACFFDILGPAHVSMAANRHATSLINLDSLDLPFEVERADILNVTFTSVKSDLSITIKNQDNKIVTGYPFIASLSLEGSDDDPITLTNTKKDGLIYFDKLEEGDYVLALIDTGDYGAPNPMKVKIEPPVEHKKIDVSDKVVSQNTVNLAAEDGQYGKHANDKTENVPFPKDTVEFVESRIETIQGTDNVPLLDSSGKQIYMYKPVLGGVDNMYITTTDALVTDLKAVCDSKGYLIKGQRVIPNSSDYEDISVIGSNYNLLPYGDKEINAEKIALTAAPTETKTTYYGWQKMNNKTYYFDKNGNKVTGKQVIQGMDYFFNSDGSTNNIVGIDVSYWQGNINWAKVKASGVDFAIIRIGFMGWTSGALVKDSTCARNLAGAKAAGLKVGIYFFDVAITEKEAVEEASMCLQLLAGQSLDYPVFIDMEYAASNARNNSLTVQQRTMICEAFCNTIRNGGYRAGVYSSSSYLNNKLNMSRLNKYYVWVAHWGVKAPSYGGRYDFWQYSQSGTVDGISGAVDMNISYMGY